MLKPNMPNIPGMGAMNDTLEFVKNLWGGMGIPGAGEPNMGIPGMGIPGMVVPTLSVEEIRKKVADLKVVEAWLELNTNMLRGTIQALEVQAATISTLQTMGEAFNATVNAGTANLRASAPTMPQDLSAWQQPEAPSPSRDTARQAATPEPTSRDEADAAALTAPLVNAAAWWNALQGQFAQAVNNAMTAEAPAAAPRTPANGQAKQSGASAKKQPRRRKSEH